MSSVALSSEHLAALRKMIRPVSQAPAQAPAVSEISENGPVPNNEPVTQDFRTVLMNYVKAQQESEESRALAFLAKALAPDSAPASSAVPAISSQVPAPNNEPVTSQDSVERLKELVKKTLQEDKTTAPAASEPAAASASPNFASHHLSTGLKNDCDKVAEGLRYFRPDFDPKKRIGSSVRVNRLGCSTCTVEEYKNKCPDSLKRLYKNKTRH